MKMLLIYPRWSKLERQTEFHLPPHGPVVFAATLPPEVEVEFVDENLEAVDFAASADLVALSVMLSCQLPRAFEIARRFREQGRTVIFGGIAVMLHAEEVALHADAVFLGEAEGRMAAVIDGLNASFARQLESMGSNLLFFYRFEPGIHVERLPDELRRRKPIAFADAEARSAPARWWPP